MPTQSRGARAAWRNDRAPHRRPSRTPAIVARRRGRECLACKGFQTGGGAFARWHITSTDICEASFPLLRTIRQRRFTHAVAFHGFSEAGVLVGGGAPLAFKVKIAEELADALAGSSIHVRIADPSEQYDGDSPWNIVNRLTACGTNGVQIEQSIEAGERFWETIADAVASVYQRETPTAG